VIPGPALAAKLAGVPHVWHVRDSFLEFRSLWRFYRKYITGLSDRVVTVSGAIAEQFAAAPNVRIIHNGLAPDEYAVADPDLGGQFRKTHGIDANAVIVGCVGRIKFIRKGQEILVQAAALLKERGIEAKYLIVGSAAVGNEEHLTNLKEMIVKLNLTNDVILAGELSEVRPAYAAMDIFVLPSAQPEPFGGVVLEAMGMALPIVATAIGGTIDQVKDRETGFLVPPRDPAALAEKLALFIKDPALRRKYGMAGRDRLRECFSLERLLNQLTALYEEVLSERHVAARS
jgi:glycosyltransferase involved in cell wall biosynthesis